MSENYISILADKFKVAIEQNKPFCFPAMTVKELKFLLTLI